MTKAVHLPSLVQHARTLGLLVSQVRDRMFVTAPLLGVYGVACGEKGLIDLCYRMRNVPDKRSVGKRSLDTSLHFRTAMMCEQMPRYADERARVFYCPIHHIVKDHRDHTRYVALRRAAERAVA